MTGRAAVGSAGLAAVGSTAVAVDFFVLGFVAVLWQQVSTTAAGDCCRQLSSAKTEKRKPDIQERDFQTQYYEKIRLVAIITITKQ
jgi:hypothetical protein